MASSYGGIAQLVEHSVHTRSVICSSQIAATRPVGQAVKTPPFHGGNMGSIPVRVTKKKPSNRMVSFLLSVCRSESIGFDHKHFAIARWPRCTASRLLAKPKENAPWHEGGSAAGVFPYRFAVDPKSHMAQKPSIRMVEPEPAAVFENRMPMRYNAIKMSAQQTARRFVSRQRLL